MMSHKAILFSAPSGSGKTTIIKHLMQYFDCFEFSISATSRPPRAGECDGKDYYFLTLDEFRRRIANHEFLEWEEVYEGVCYGTLKSEINRIWADGKVIIFDVDVNGGKNLKRYFGDDALSLFIMPPSIDELERRLRSRGSETEDTIAKRIGRSAAELREAPSFDYTIVNDDLNHAIEEARHIIEKYLKQA